MIGFFQYGSYPVTMRWMILQVTSPPGEATGLGPPGSARYSKVSGDGKPGSESPTAVICQMIKVVAEESWRNPWVMASTRPGEQPQKAIEAMAQSNSGFSHEKYLKMAIFNSYENVHQRVISSNCSESLMNVHNMENSIHSHSLIEWIMTIPESRLV